MAEGMTYTGSGVDYAAMDPFKRMAQLAGRETADNLKLFGFREFEPSRGESAYLIDVGEAYLAHVEEGLGTKNLVADEMYRLTGKSYYDQIAQDTVAMIVNDMITVGALPLSVAMHLAVGESKWFEDERRAQDLVDGWRIACHLANCAWGGGETPTLKGVVVPGTVVLSGSAVGVVRPKESLIAGDIRPGDLIYFLLSSGIHANGLTLARQVAELLPKGYLTELSDGRAYGEALLDPTHIYVRVVESCIERGIRLRYAVNVTGHGWRKLMRSPKSLAYVIDRIPEPPAVFEELHKPGRMNTREAYGNLNMGAGFALIAAPEDAEALEELLAERSDPFGWIRAGRVEESAEKKVVILPKGIEFSAETLQVR